MIVNINLTVEYLASAIEDSVIICDEIINDADSVSINLPTNAATSTVLRNFHNKKVRYKIDCYIMYTVLLVIILLFMIVIIMKKWKTM